MKHIKTYQIFESSYLMEDIEDCCLELTDLPFNFYLEEYKTGITDRIITNDRWDVIKNKVSDGGKGSYIKLVGEVLGERLSLVCQGIWNDKIESLKTQSETLSWYDRIHGSYEDITIDGLSKEKGGEYMKLILEVLPGVLSKLKRYVIGDDKSIYFMVNMYEVQRGTCIVVMIEYR